MGYILGGRSNESVEEFRDRFRKYYEYIESVKHLLPPSAYSFATAAWHYNYSDPRCPHDAWVDSVTIQEREYPVDSERNRRSIDIFVRLVGAYHDGYIELTYKGVCRYSMNMDTDGGHGDWMVDEIRLSNDGLVEHEIIFMTSKWVIECEDIIYDWKPFSETAVENAS